MNRDMKQNKSDKEIISMFQHYLSTNDSSEIDKLNSEELAVAEVRLGLKGINPTFRDAIKNKIKDLELKESRKHESRIRAWNLVTGLILGLTIAGISAWLFST